MPDILGIFNRMIEGDDALLVLAALRYAEAGIGAEMYPWGPEYLPVVRNFLPETSVCTIHLARDLDSSTPMGREQILAYARTAGGRLRGMVTHDNPNLVANPDATYEGYARLDEFLNKVDGPALYVEYACGLPFVQFRDLVRGFERFRKIGACIDIGHLAIRACQEEYARTHPGEDICAIKPDHPNLPALLPEIEAAADQAFERVLDITADITALQIPLQLHLHNGHPLSTFSRYGVCDHLPFFWSIPLPFEHQGRRSVDGIYTIKRLERLIAVLRKGGKLTRLNYMLEIHPQPGRRPLGEYEYLFQHWQDTRNAEEMNYWLDLITQNAAILRSLLG